jgi:5-oxoprolinase (ATP-hydrolysing)
MPKNTEAVEDAPDPILLEIFNNHFAGIAEQMGITLRNTSSSVNVKERLDFSCALFTSSGDLVVNAPHIPVHLGAMSETVKEILAANPNMQPGDVFVTNDPFRGGSHLPDITVVTPVHDTETTELQFVTASRAHHAELGGITPGSMPPFSTNLAEEGVLIRNVRVLDAGTSQLDNLRNLLLAGTHPTRAVDDNLADVTAQIAANHQGARDLRQLVDRYTWPVVRAFMTHMQSAAQRKMRLALSRFPDGRRVFTDHLDDGSPITVAVTVTGDSAAVDFTGTGPVLSGNLNANRAIVTAAVMYCLRLLIDEDIPLNQGVLAPVEIVLPECLLNPPAREKPEQCPAIAGGNVETSQRVVDVLLGALGIAAASQGTMNNLLFGDDSFGYYETICGGTGATATADGADAVHSHMTNTRLTDPEVLEHRYPVRLWRFAVRRGSGGAGRHHGGDGVVREIEFLRDVTVSILSQRRGPYPPYSCDGGQAGATGKNTLKRRDGTVERLANLAQFSARQGDRIVIETPGGGGFGAEDSTLLR